MKTTLTTRDIPAGLFSNLLLRDQKYCEMTSEKDRVGVRLAAVNPNGNVTALLSARRRREKVSSMTPPPPPFKSPPRSGRVWGEVELAPFGF